MWEPVPVNWIVETAPPSSADSKLLSERYEPLVTARDVFDELPPSCMSPPPRVDEESTVTANVPVVAMRSPPPALRLRNAPESTASDPEPPEKESPPVTPNDAPRITSSREAPAVALMLMGEPAVATPPSTRKVPPSQSKSPLMPSIVKFFTWQKPPFMCSTPVPPSGSPTRRLSLTIIVPPALTLIPPKPPETAAVALLATVHTSFTVTIELAPVMLSWPFTPAAAIAISSATLTTPDEATLSEPLPPLPTSTSASVVAVSKVDELSALAPVTNRTPPLPAALPRIRSSLTRTTPPPLTVRLPAPEAPTTRSAPAFCTWNRTFEPVTVMLPVLPAALPIVDVPPVASVPAVTFAVALSPFCEPTTTPAEAKCGDVNESRFVPVR